MSDLPTVRTIRTLVKTPWGFMAYGQTTVGDDDEDGLLARYRALAMAKRNIIHPALPEEMTVAMPTATENTRLSVTETIVRISLDSSVDDVIEKKDSFTVEMWEIPDDADVDPQWQ